MITSLLSIIAKSQREPVVYFLHVFLQGHRAAAGHDGHGKHGHSQFEKAGNAGSKKWIYHHGSPAKTANLVVIDRRADQFYHGPQYFG